MMNSDSSRIRRARSSAVAIRRAFSASASCLMPAVIALISCSSAVRRFSCCSKRAWAAARASAAAARSL